VSEVPVIDRPPFSNSIGRPDIIGNPVLGSFQRGCGTTFNDRQCSNQKASNQNLDSVLKTFQHTGASYLDYRDNLRSLAICCRILFEFFRFKRGYK
jgi:hypothetical protein